MLEKVEIVFENNSVVKVTTVRQTEPREERPESEKAQEEEPEDGEVPTYLVGSWFLRDCYNQLMQTNKEMLHDVTGVKHNGTYTLERIVPLRLDESSPCYARSDVISTRDALMDMHRFGYLLTGVFHSHPGSGKHCVRPSGTDISNQKKLEDTGYKCISAIFSRDGWIRFFTNRNPFRVVVKGKGVEKVGDNLFRLTQTSCL